MGELLIVTGPPGAGKSTLAEPLAAARSPSVLVAGDAFFAFLREGRIEPWLPASDDQNQIVGRAAAAATGHFARHCWTVYDGVLGPWDLPMFLAVTGLGAAHYVMLLPPVERCVERVATRAGHGFTDPAATRHMHDQFHTAAIDERHVLRDPSAGVTELADLVLRRVADGSLRVAR